MSYEDRYYDIAKWVGKTLIHVKEDTDNIRFVFDDGEIFDMFHDQDCCESVSVEDVNGDWQDLIGSPLLVSEEVNSDDPGPQSDYDESYTWAFYKFATVKGYVDVRWYGTSNGYYSESVQVSKR